MALPIDTTLALRTHRQLTELIEQIVSAPAAEPETYSLEWKSELDLVGDVGARFKVAKSILAFANRHPDHAAAEFEGCGYIVLGAEPDGHPRGTPAHDPAALEDWLGAFVGTDGPRWRPDYVNVAERDVLVVTVEAPRWGDPMHVLRKAFNNFAPGRVFVRRHGKSVEADYGEMQMLQDRLKRPSNVRVSVEFAGDRPTLFTYEAPLDDWTRWMPTERDRFYRPINQEVELAGLVGHLASTSLTGIPPDARSLAVYKDEVEAYLVVLPTHVVNATDRR